MLFTFHVNDTLFNMFMVLLLQCAQSKHEICLSFPFEHYKRYFKKKPNSLNCLRIELSAVKNNGFDSTVMNWYIDQVSAEISVYDLIHPILSSQYTCIINMLGKSSAFYQYLMFTNLLTRCPFSLYNLK